MSIAESPRSAQQRPEQEQSNILLSSLRQLQQQQLGGSTAIVPQLPVVMPMSAMSAPLPAIFQQQVLQPSLAVPSTHSEVLLRLAASEREQAIKQQYEQLRLQQELAQLTAAAQGDNLDLLSLSQRGQQQQQLANAAIVGNLLGNVSSTFNQPLLNPLQSGVNANAILAGRSAFNQQPGLSSNPKLVSKLVIGGPEERPRKKAKYGNDKVTEYNKKPKKSIVKPIKPKKKDIKWMESLNKLKEYRMEYGDCLVPRGFDENPRLASWVAEQRKQYKLMSDGKPSSITLQRVSLLNEIDFAWNAQEAAWTRNMNDLKKFRKKNNHTHVPLRHPEFPKLGLWVKEQRRHFALMKQGKKKQSHMTIERARALDEIDFCWDTHEATWLERLKELREYKKTHGNCNVPTSYSVIPKLGTWVHHQRRQYKLYQQGKPCHITEARINALKELDFVWSPRQRYNNKETESVGSCEDDTLTESDEESEDGSVESEASSIDFRPRKSILHSKRRKVDV